MKKIIVIGSGGAGKSTFSKRLGNALNIEVIHLDALYWKPNWEKTPRDEWTEIVRNLLERDSWVMDGNFGGTREMRLKACDMVIFFDLPRRICLYRVLKRFFLYRGKTRPEMADSCNEKIDLEFISWIWNYPNRNRPRILEEMEHFAEKRLVILLSVREIDLFLQCL
jgi:adenylate kinase family enzyme